MDQLQLAIIIGSTRQGRLSPTVARWFAGQVERRKDMSIDMIDLVEAGLPEVMSRNPGDSVPAMARRLGAADAFVVVTPEYNHSFPAPLKTAIDWHSQEWRAKPVGFVSYGGISGGLRAVEHLRHVFAEVHATTVRDTVSFHNVWERFDSEGQPKELAACEGAATKMLDQLAWWAHALRDAKQKRPYGS